MKTKGNCSEFEWMIGPLVDGELPPADAEEVEKHLGSCHACTRTAEDFRSFDRLASRLEEPPAVTTFEWARMMEQVRREPEVLHLGIRRRVLDWMVPALSLAALALLGAWLAISIINQLGEDKPMNAAKTREKGAIQVQEKAPLHKLKGETKDL
jgi:anti-sigma factor RsiW